LERVGGGGREEKEERREGEKEEEEVEGVKANTQLKARVLVDSSPTLIHLILIDALQMSYSPATSNPCGPIRKELLT
jgi:hypothetical protein